MNENLNWLLDKKYWELIDCPNCGAKVEKLKHYQITSCKKCGVPIMVWG